MALSPVGVSFWCAQNRSIRILNQLNNKQYHCFGDGLGTCRIYRDRHGLRLSPSFQINFTLTGIPNAVKRLRQFTMTAASVFWFGRVRHLKVGMNKAFTRCMPPQVLPLDRANTRPGEIRGNMPLFSLTQASKTQVVCEMLTVFIKAIGGHPDPQSQRSIQCRVTHGPPCGATANPP